MKAVRIHEFGGPEVLRYEDVPDPKPRKDQVLVRVKACAMNHLDFWVRKGLPGVNLPHIPGSDVAGEIVELGEYVTGFKPGQRVLLAPMHFCNRCAKCSRDAGSGYCAGGKPMPPVHTRSDRNPASCRLSRTKLETNIAAQASSTTDNPTWAVTKPRRKRCWPRLPLVPRPPSLSPSTRSARELCQAG